MFLEIEKSSSVEFCGNVTTGIPCTGRSNNFLRFTVEANELKFANFISVTDCRIYSSGDMLMT